MCSSDLLNTVGIFHSEEQVFYCYPSNILFSFHESSAFISSYLILLTEYCFVRVVFQAFDTSYIQYYAGAAFFEG